MTFQRRVAAQRFALRLFAMVTAAAVLAGFTQYGLSAYFADRRATGTAMAAHRNDGRLITAVSSLPNGLETLQTMIGSFSAHAGIEHASVVAADGEVLADLHAEHRGGFVAAEEVEAIRRAVATGEVLVFPEAPAEEHDAHEADDHDREEAEHADADAAENHDGHDVYVTPVDIAGRDAALVVTQDKSIVAQDVAAARVQAVASGAVVAIVVFASFGLLGGRRLLRQHGSAVDQAYIDALTGVGTRLALEHHVRAEARSADRTGGQFAFAVVDLDHFKEVNDTLGHVRGDGVLVTVAARLAACPGGQVFRLGGDEFALLLPERTAAEAILVLEALRHDVEDLSLGVTMSGGVTDNTEGSRFEDLLSRADLALYTSKQTGRNRVSVLSTDAIPDIVTDADVAALDDLLRSEAIRIAFQPIVASPSRSVIGYEALTRPLGATFAAPDRLFAVADALRRVGELDRLCITQAIQAARALPRDATVFLNVHPRSLVKHDIDAEFVMQIAVENGIDTDRLVLEVTERVHIDTATLADACRAITDAGLNIALDDVGTGHNGLELIRTVRFSHLKVDRSVIAAATTDHRAVAVLSGLAVVAAHSGAVLVAEGIEDEAMAAAVTAHPGAVRPQLLLQGFLFGRPEEITVDPRSFASRLVRSAEPHPSDLVG